MSVIIRRQKKAAKDGERHWFCAWETYPGGKRTARTIPPKDYHRYGLNDDLTYEEARSAADQFNIRERKQRIEEKRQKIQERIRVAEEEELLLMPTAFAKVFLQEKLEETSDKRQQARLRTRWHAVRRLLKETRIECWDWNRRKRAIYQHFAQKALSPDYVRKIIYVMNQWGEFLGDKQNRVFKPLPQPRGGDRQVILDAYEDNLVSPKESLPITPDELAKAKQTMKLEHWNWVFVTLWFGLRPDEMRVLRKEQFKYEVEEIEGVRQVVFYQPKKRRLPRHKRYKRVPILFPEQKEALALLDKEQVEEPLPATMKRHFKKRVHLYAGRKGFQDLMTSKGRTFFEIQDWMGHEDINRTWNSYRNRQRALIEGKKTG